MNKSYKVKVNTTTEIDITNNDVSALDTIEVSSSKFHILQNNTPFKAEIIEGDFNNKT